MGELSTSYPLIEALFEVRYIREGAQPLPPDAEQRLGAALAEHYPERQRVTEPHIGVQVQQQGNQLETRLVPPGHRVVYRARPPTRLVQLSPQALTINMLAPYAGRAAFIGLVRRDWELAQKALQLRLGPQMTMRFVNRIERASHRLEPAMWLRSGSFVPRGVLHAPAGFLSKVQLQSEDETMGTAVTVGTLAAPDEADGPLPLLLDIEVTCATTTILPTRPFAAQLEAMYRAARQAFFSSTSSDAQAQWAA